MYSEGLRVSIDMVFVSRGVARGVARGGLCYDRGLHGRALAHSLASQFVVASQ